MKKIVIVLALCLILSGCGRAPDPRILTATVVDVQDHIIVVLPTKSVSARTPADQIQVSTSAIPELEVERGDTVRIEYLGTVTETSPMCLEDVQSIELVWHDPQAAATTPAEPEVIALPHRLEMTFCPNGTVSTSLNINVDGSFSGSFQESNPEETGEGYPNGTHRYCHFQGRFQIISKLNDNTYSLALAELRSEQPAGEQSVKNDTLYISATPYGLEGGSEFKLYAPHTPVSQLSKPFLTWLPGSSADPTPETLNLWGLHNLSSDIGFFTAPAA